MLLGQRGDEHGLRRPIKLIAFAGRVERQDADRDPRVVFDRLAVLHRLRGELNHPAGRSERGMAARPAVMVTTSAAAFRGAVRGTG